MLINARAKVSSLREVMFPANLNVADANRKTPGQTVIAHISDLHFTSKTNFETGPWAALFQDLASDNHNKIDLLAVTGDLIDASFRDSIQGLMPKVVIKDPIEEAFNKVYAYLKKLCDALDIKYDTGLFVVPGNHDYRAKGILRSSRQPAKFYSVFKTCCRPILLPKLHLCVFVLDSNTMKNKYDLATGLIERDDLVKFRSFAEKIRPRSSACTRIVLLHHHPMPIPARETGKLGDNPGFSLLKNAGQFMSLMVEARINLVLHGHEHHHAFSKAFFPDDKLQEHMITVIGAGSAGEKGIPNYNLLTITDGGQMTLERRSLEGAVFRHQYRRPLGNYEDARKAAFEGLAEKTGAIIRASKYSEVYIVKGVSGDADWHERLEGVRAFKEDVTELETSTTSDSGFFSAPSFHRITPDGQNVTWDWAPRAADPLEATGSARSAKIIFSPPLNKLNHIKYETRRKAYNLFHFNQQEREDVTDGKFKQDGIWFTFKNAFDLYVLSVCFPEGHFPEKFYREVHSPDCYGTEHGKACIRDAREEEYFNLHFSKFKDTRTVVAAIERPLPGYTYRILWDLPLEEDKLTLPDQGLAADLLDRLLQLRDPGGLYQSEVENWLKKLREDITKSKMWRSLKGTDEMEIFLYTYNSETRDWKKRGLVCVATTLLGLLNTSEEEVIKSGKTIVGASYRRKEPMIYSPMGKHPRLAEAEYVNRIPGGWKQGNGGPSKKFTAVWTIPLYYPIRKDFIGRKVAVLAFSSTSNQSRLLNFVPRSQAGLSKEQIDELKKKRDTLEYFVMTTLFRELARILEVEPLE